MIEFRQLQRLRQLMQAVARKPREKPAGNLDGTKPRRINLDATALEFRPHELAVELHIVRHKDAVLQ